MIRGIVDRSDRGDQMECESPAKQRISARSITWSVLAVRSIVIHVIDRAEPANPHFLYRTVDTVAKSQVPL